MRTTVGDGNVGPYPTSIGVACATSDEREPRAVAVTVIMPVYNGASTLERAVASVFNQTLSGVELIACDDGSTDSSLDLLLQLADRHDRLRVLRSAANQGPGPARNQALARASGRWVAILDADDWYAPGRLEHLVRLGEQTGADFVADNQFLYDAGADRIVGAGMSPRDAFAPMRLDDLLLNSITGRTHYDYGLLQPVIRRAFLDEHRIRYVETCRFGEDFLFALDCFAAGAKGVLSFMPMYYVTQPYGWGSGELSRPDREPYDYDAMRRANDLAVHRYRGRLTRRQRRLLERRSRAIDLYRRYLTYTGAGLRPPWRIAGALCVPSLWPYVLHSIGRRTRALRSRLRRCGATEAAP